MANCYLVKTRDPGHSLLMHEDLNTEIWRLPPKPFLKVARKACESHQKEVSATLLTGFKSSALSESPPKKRTSANQNHLINCPHQSPPKQLCHQNQIALHQHLQCKSDVQSSICTFVQFISMTVTLLSCLKSKWWAAPWRNNLFWGSDAEHLHFPGTIESIAMWEAKQYQELIDNAK